ncbi:MAG: hypothetical protein HY670_09865 [Chloroflexi bacterium]|nr:hypothetical protein [Chloroflexota bacterium]
MQQSNKRGGWAGKILKIDLTAGKVVEEPVTDELAYSFLGGRGFDAKFLWDMVRPGIDPLAPEAVLTLGAGLLTGTVYPECGRVNVGCLSPLTGIYGFGNSGGWWPTRLKAAGYDHIIITGRSPKPVYVLINDDGVEIKDAGDIWGKTTTETEKILRDKHGRDVRVAGIGPAGENLVRTATTIVDASYSAHGGSGAVWGSKNLKAIAVTGTKKIHIHDPQTFYDLAKQEIKRIRECTRQGEAEYKKYGTLILYKWLPKYVGHGADKRYLPPEEMDHLQPENLFEKYCVGYHAACSNCQENCTYLWEVNVGPYAGTRTGALRFGSTDYMTMGMGNANTSSMVKFHSLCNQYGLCGKMAATALYFALELYERGILTKEDTDGIEIKAGDHEAIIELTHMIALRQGFGKILGEGPGNMARFIKDAYPYRHGVYGRIYTALLPFITSTRGTDHLGCLETFTATPETRNKLHENLVKIYPDLGPPMEPGIQGKTRLMFWEEHHKTVLDCMGRCFIAGGGISGCPSIGYELDEDPMGEGQARLLTILTGREFTGAEILKAGERIFNLERAFNVRQGAGRESDMAAPADQNIQFDWLALGKVDGNIMRQYLDQYYETRGWDKDGVPTRAKLEELGLGYVADELEANRPYPPYQGPPLWPIDKYPSGGERTKW